MCGLFLWATLKKNSGTIWCRCKLKNRDIFIIESLFRFYKLKFLRLRFTFKFMHVNSGF